MIKVCDFPCNNRQERDVEEQRQIELFGAELNTNSAISFIVPSIKIKIIERKRQQLGVRANREETITTYRENRSKTDTTH